jgi:hypothetical protein
MAEKRKGVEVKARTYSVEKVEMVAKVLAEAPALQPKFIAHESTLAELSKHIKELYSKKNYDARQITALLKQNGIKSTLKEVKDLIGIGAKNSAKSGS